MLVLRDRGGEHRVLVRQETHAGHRTRRVRHRHRHVPVRPDDPILDRGVRMAGNRAPAGRHVLQLLRVRRPDARPRLADRRAEEAAGRGSRGRRRIGGRRHGQTMGRHRGVDRRPLSAGGRRERDVVAVARRRGRLPGIHRARGRVPATGTAAVPGRRTVQAYGERGTGR